MEQPGDTNSSNAAPQSGDIMTAADMMNNPSVLASLQDRLPFDSKLQALSHYQSLPEPVKRRIRALKKLQYKTLMIESDFYKELHELEIKYASKYLDQMERRNEVVNGKVEPTDEDADWPEDIEADAELSFALKSKMALTQNGETGGETPADEATTTGISNFWLTVFKNVELIAQMIQTHDEPILKQLVDVRVNLFSGDETGFTLEFHFSPNDYFTNEVLTKTYYLRLLPDAEHPWGFDGPEIVRCKGCAISWKQGKNVTIKVVKKIQKHKAGGQKRTITKAVEADSFFNFFSPPEQSVDELDADEEETENLLNSDFEIGHFLRERVIPRAVLFFTGDALDDDEEFDEEEDEDDDDDEELDDGDDSDEQANRPRNNRQPQQECKQQ